jgi:hypothetical protein
LNDQAGPAKPAPTVRLHPDGWPDLLGRRPMSSGDRAKIRHALDAGLNPAVVSSLSPLAVPLLLKPRDQPDQAAAARRDP